MTLSVQTKKNLIVHITSENPGELRDRLSLNGLFKSHYDGWESSVEPGVGVLSTRYYYYEIPHDVTKMLRHLQSVREEVVLKIKILPEGCGWHAFD